MQDQELIRVDELARAIARAMGYTGAAFGLEAVNLENEVFAVARRGDVCLYRSDKPYPVALNGLEAPHSELRLLREDATKLITKFLGMPQSIDTQPQAAPSMTGSAADGLEPLKSEPEPQQADTRPQAVKPEAPSVRRRDLLAPLIEDAQQKCKNPYDTPAVWAELQAMAKEKRPPLLGATEDGLQWIDDADTAQFLSLKNLRDRLGRQKIAARKGARRRPKVP